MGRKFLSTSSARRTTIARIQVDHRAHISIHVLREEDDQRPAPILALSGISIHVLREEDDRSNVKTLEGIIKFLSTSSARRTTRIRSPERPGTDISIHVLREEDDAGMIDQVTMDLYFYPRPPRGGRPYAERYSPSYSSISLSPTFNLNEFLF